MKRLFLLTQLLLIGVLTAVAQQIAGRVIDAKSKEGLPFVNVFYEGGKGGVQTDTQGYFHLPFRKGQKLMVSSVGYETFATRLRSNDSLLVQLKSSDLGLGEAAVVGKRGKYSRKNNPAVILMEKVIAAKKSSDLRQHDFYSVERYDKMSFALSDITPTAFDEGALKKVSFMKEHVEVSKETGKLILPLSVEEIIAQDIYRKSKNELKSIVKGKRTSGINELIETGDIVNSMLQDVFTEVDLYKDNIRFLQAQFLSPIATNGAIAFYRYFIEDTTYVDGNKCIQVSFGPNNPRDFGFTGSLYILADSSFRISKAEISIPVKSTVNFIKHIKIAQSFTLLPSGEQVMSKSNMFIILEAAKFLNTLEVHHDIEYSNYSFLPLSERLFKFVGKNKIDSDAEMQDESFWKEHRAVALTQSESKTSDLISRLRNVPGLKPIIWVATSFIENFVPTSVDEKNPSKFDIGPINTMFTTNPVDGFRLRLSALTTANLTPQLFWRGYLAYGFRDQRWKGMAEMTYSLKKKKYLPMEFPTANLTLSYAYDVSVPSDQYLTTDKDNVFFAFKWAPIKHMMYDRSLKLTFDREWENGLQWKTRLRYSQSEPTYHLFYQPVAHGLHTLDAEGHYAPRPYGPADEHGGQMWWEKNRHFLTTADLMMSLLYQPGVAYINTKQRRKLVNKEAPIFRIAHTVGLSSLGSDFTSNMTEIGVRKRFWFNSWGRMDFDLSAGAQWNSVPFPQLFMPRTNLAYVYDDDMFYLMNNMEFLNDRYAQLMFNWSMNGKLFNRIPLLRSLKIREHLGCNILWGRLTDKNNPYLWENRNREDLFFFPGEFNADGSFHTSSRVMNPRVPYVEAAFGVHNIFKILHVDYVRRFTYLNDPRTTKWGIRFMFRIIF